MKRWTLKPKNVLVGGVVGSWLLLMVLEAGLGLVTAWYTWRMNRVMRAVARGLRWARKAAVLTLLALNAALLLSIRHHGKAKPESPARW